MLIFLIPPSEAKNGGGAEVSVGSRAEANLPLEIAANASMKDLACKGDRYAEGIQLNKNILTSEQMPAGERYSGVMYKAIGYDSMTTVVQSYYECHILIISGMYGVVSPQTLIGNYKLPIHVSGLKQRWGDAMTDSLLEVGARGSSVIFVDLLPGAHQKLINSQRIREEGHQYITVNFFKSEAGELKKYTHGVKKVKGERLRNVCGNQIQELEGLGDMENDEIQIIM